MNMPNINPDKFPKGYIFKGSNGESFVIIVDSRGKNRWQKITEKPNQSYLNKVKESISLMNETIDGDPNEAIELKEILDKKINNLRNLEDDEEVKEAVDLLKNFRNQVYKHGGQLKKIQDEINLYESAYNKTDSSYNKKILAEKINKLKTQLI
jgi:hypothetical protein